MSGKTPHQHQPSEDVRRDLPIEPGVKLDEDIVPIVVVRPDLWIASFEGTGFLIAPRVLVTCWHCVRATPSPGNRYAALLPEREGGFKAAFLMDISQHPRGIDLATARMEARPNAGLILSGVALTLGADVLSFGYPYSNLTQVAPGNRTLNLVARHLEGYITRSFRDEDRGFGPTDAYELDMPTPQGLSGAPLIKMHSREVVGVIYGTNDVALVSHFERFDEKGVREPEVQRVVSFGLAHYTTALHTLSGPATQGLLLPDYIRQETGVG